MYNHEQWTATKCISMIKDTIIYCTSIFINAEISNCLQLQERIRSCTTSHSQNEMQIPLHATTPVYDRI